jgi:hypothetical protein
LTLYLYQNKKGLLNRRMRLRKARGNLLFLGLLAGLRVCSLVDRVAAGGRNSLSQT